MRTSRCCILLALVVVTGCVHHVSPFRKFDIGEQIALQIAWSPDGKRIAARTADGVLRVWDVETAAQIDRVDLGTPAAYRYSVGGIAFSPDGRTIAFAKEPRSLAIKRISEDAIREFHGYSSDVSTVEFSSDGRTVFAASGGLTYPQPLWVGRSDARKRPWSPPALYPIEVLGFDVESGELRYRIDTRGFVNIEFSRGASLIAGTYIPGTVGANWPLEIHELDPSGGSELRVIRTTDQSVVGSFTPTAWFAHPSVNGRWLANNRTIYDLLSGKVARSTDLCILRFVDDDRCVLTTESGGFGYFLALASTPFVRLVYVRLSDGRAKDLGKYVSEGGRGSLGTALTHPQQVSPDGRFAVDPLMNLWRVPR